MKNVLLILCLSFLYAPLFSQGGEQPSLTSDPSLDILPPSPSAAALQQYTDFPIGYHTGTPNIDIPIHTLGGRGISVPISLSYHAGGVKVDQVASNVGLGWSLNAGGMVSRTIMGKADEAADGFIAQGHKVPYPLDLTTNFDDFKGFAELGQDGQPDMFNFSVGGYSGKFHLFKPGPQEPVQVRLMPHQDIKITYDTCRSNCPPILTDIYTFTITTPDGMQYTLGGGNAYETSETGSTTSECRVKNYDIPYITTWHLTKIHNPATKDDVLFYYNDSEISYDLSYTESFSRPLSTHNACDGQYTSSKCITTKTDKGKVLSSIVSTHGVVEFEINNDRQDVNIGTIGGNRITDILIKGTSGNLLKKYSLVQTFIQSSGNVPDHLDNTSKWRMYLDEIQAYDSNNQFIKSHKIDYHNREELPPRLSFEQDHWGYMNSNTARQLTPVLYHTEYEKFSNHFNDFAAADRRPDPLLSKTGTLNRITYPTGGTVSYEFEGNEIAACRELPRKIDQEAKVQADYVDQEVSDYETFTLEFGQVVELSYSIFKIEDLFLGAYLKIARTSAPAQNVFDWNAYYGHGATPYCSDSTIYFYLSAGTYEMEAHARTELASNDTPCTFGSATQENAAMTLRYQDIVYEETENIPIGGIRLKSVTYDDGDNDTSNNIYREMVYKAEDENGCFRSTAVEMGRSPHYISQDISIVDPSEGGIACDYATCTSLRHTSSSINNLTNTAGNIVGYGRVWELQGVDGSNGKTGYKYSIATDLDSELGINRYNVLLSSPKIDQSYKSGKLLEKKVYNAEGHLLNETINTYEFEETNLNYQPTKAIITRKVFDLDCPENATFVCDGENNAGDEFLYNCWEDQNTYLEILGVLTHTGPIFPVINCSFITGPCFDQPANTVITNSSALNEYAYEFYDCFSQWVYLKNSTNRTYSDDGSGDFVETITTYGYDATGRYTMPTDITMTNSDGKEYRNEFLYAHDYTGAAYTQMVNDNIIATPIEMRKIVDNLQVDAQRTTFAIRHGYPYAVQAERYELTWDESGNIVDDGWKNQWEIDAHHPTYGLPTQYTSDGWQNSQEYEWDARGLLLSKTFIDQIQTYTWDQNRPLLLRETGIDGQYIDYTYDDFQRTQAIFARPKYGTPPPPTIPNANDYHVTKTFDYQYHQGSGIPENFVETHTNFTTVTGSDFTTSHDKQYLDGLGRPTAGIKVAYSPTNDDVVTFTKYDEQGRPFKVYEPFESDETNGDYEEPIPSGNFHPFTETTYEASPLNRVRTVRPPNWTSVTTTTYGVHPSNFIIHPAGNNENYPANSLLTTTVADGDGRSTINYTDKRGKNVAMSQTNGTNTATTRYVYDDKERQTRVYPPGSSVFSTDLLFEQFYDGDDNVLVSKIPGKEAVNMYYDERNLPIVMQDGKMLDENRWLVTEYDAYGRPTATGFENAPSPAEVYTPIIDDGLTQTFYDGEGSNPIGDPIYNGRVRSTRTRILDGNTVSNNWLETTLTYDEYGRTYSTDANNHLDNGVENTVHLYDYADNMVFDYRRHGQGVVPVYRVIEQNMTYDHRGRLSSTIHSIDGNAQQINELAYNTKDLLTRRYLGGHATNALQEVNYAYNARNFLTNINTPGILGNDLFAMRLKYNSVDSDFTTAVAQENGNIAQILWETPSMTEIATYGFSYDYLNRLTKAEYGVIDDGGSGETSLSGVSLNNHYSSDYMYHDARGNIKNITRQGRINVDGTWTSQEIDDLTLHYKNNSNQLSYIEDAAGVPSCPGLRNLTGTEGGAKIEYGTVISSTQTVEQTAILDYIASDCINLNENFEVELGAEFLADIGPCSPQGYGFVDDVDSDTYLYDANGNMTYDPDKNITISYGYLNLPYLITFDDGRWISFLYDAGGMKLRKERSDGYVKDYVSGIEYENGILEAIYHEEGRAIPDGNSFKYQYCAKDHLGNTRVMFQDNGSGVAELLSENHFYSFGMAQNGNWNQQTNPKQNYLYTGFERQHDYGLNLDMAQFRTFDFTSCRWLQIDPMASEMSAWSPYNYGLNNPIRFIDPDGRMAVDAQADTPPNEYLITYNDDGTVKSEEQISNRGGNDFDIIHHQRGNVPEVNSSLTTEVAVNSEGGDRIAPGAFAPRAATGLVTPIEDPITSGEVAVMKGSFLMLAVIKGKADDGLFVIGDGVRRAKAAQMLGKKEIKATNNAGDIFNVPINNLRSPLKDQIDISSPLKLERFKNVYNGFKAGDDLPPIYVNPGSKGVTVKDIKFKTK